jgi:hypothetical protein
VGLVKPHSISGTCLGHRTKPKPTAMQLFWSACDQIQHCIKTVTTDRPAPFAIRRPFFTLNLVHHFLSLKWDARAIDLTPLVRVDARAPSRPLRTAAPYPLLVVEPFVETLWDARHFRYSRSVGGPFGKDSLLHCCGKAPFRRRSVATPHLVVADVLVPVMTNQTTSGQ